MKIIPLLLSLLPLAADMRTLAADVPRWSVHEIALTASTGFPNAYTDVEVAASFTGPDGVARAVHGFWDGGRDFKVRFTPTAEGLWQFTVKSSPCRLRIDPERRIHMHRARSGQPRFPAA